MIQRSGQWTQEQRLQALKAFFESPDGKRFIGIFSTDCTPEEREIFIRDAERRTKTQDEDAGRWWNSLSSLVKNNPQKFLALTESLAQNGVEIEDVFNYLPEDFNSAALIQANSQASHQVIGGLAAGVTNTDGWTKNQILSRLEEVKELLRLEQADASAEEWWEYFVNENSNSPATVLRLAEELVTRKATINEFYAAYVYSGAENIQANLNYLDYSRLKKVERQANQITPLPDAVRTGLTTDDSGWWLRPAPQITRVRGWTNEMIQNHLEEVKTKMGWEEASQAIRQWWEAFEQGNIDRPALILRLAEEITKRGATVTDFYNAYRDSGVENIQANLYFLNYARLKRNEEEEKQKRDKEEQDRREWEENRRMIREEKVAKARNLFGELLPRLEINQFGLELSEFEKDILKNFPRIEVPESLRERFDQLIEEFEFETVLLDRTGKVIERRKSKARRFVEELVHGVTLEMVEIPGGKFMMGTADEDVQREIDEITRYGTSKKDAQQWVNSGRPQHEVSVSPFYLGKFTVTQDQWEAVAGFDRVERDLNPDPSNSKGQDRPVVKISWEDAQEFCARLSKETGRAYRLPTEAEWEYACRAGGTTPFSFGETMTPEIVNYDGNYPYTKAEKGEYRQATVPVGSLGVANDFGLFDLHGNVWEWCEDVWHKNYDGAPIDGSAWLSGGDSTNRVLRGGSWPSYGSNCRSANRDLNHPDYAYLNIGLRVVVGARAP